MKCPSWWAWKCQFFCIVCFKNVNEILHIHLSWCFHSLVFLVFDFLEPCKLVTRTE
jgi:hypothetical protein